MSDQAKNFESLLKDNQTSFEQTLKQLQKKQERIYVVAAEALAEWFPQYAGNAVSTQTGISSEIADESLAAMKREVLTLANSAEEIVRRHFGPKTWWHELYLKEKKEPMFQPQTDFLNAALRDARCELGVILAKYGFIDGKDVQRESFMRFVNVPVPPNVTAAFNEYTLEAVKARSLLQQRQKLESEKKSVGAKTRWDSL